MGGPRDDRAAQDANRQPSDSTATPSGGNAQKNHGKIEGPCEQEKGNLGIQDPTRAAFNECPNNSGHSSDSDEYESRIHGMRDDSVESGQGRQTV
jgi:hypothetical protein